MRVTQRRVAELEDKVDCLLWLHAELMHSLKVAAAVQVMQARKRALVEQLLNGQTPEHADTAAAVQP